MATRKSARLDPKADDPTETQGSRNSKKRKTSHDKDALSDNAVAYKSNRRGIKSKRGDSKISKDVPLDVLVEIFRLLEPVDLLHLSRVSKSLHDLLSSNDMIFLWKLVYKNTAFQPPPCPDDINIVLYTNYLYGRHCQFCCSIHGRVYHDTALIRLCSKCAENGVDGLLPSVSCLCNVSTVPKRKRAGQVILKVEYDLRAKGLKYACQRKKAESYSRDRKVDVQKRALFSGLLGGWREEVHNFQLLKLREIRTTREADIRKKLKEEGYGDDFDLIWSEFYRVPHARKSHALTDTEWSIIRADILDFFQDLRDGRALYEMEEKLLTHVEQLEAFIHQWKIHPTAWWIVKSSGPIASFIKSRLQEEIPMVDLEEFKPLLRNLLASWKEETDRYLASLISDKGKQKNPCKDQTNRLKLATTVFKCRHCTKSITYPLILRHDCLFFEGGKSRNGEDDKGNSKDARGPCGAREPRPPKHITADMVLTMLSNSHSLGMYAGAEGVTFDKEAFNAAWNIITTCGEDPNKVSHDTMKRTQARLECLRCRRVQADKKTGSTRLVMKWTMALVHELKEHSGEPSSSKPVWRKIEAPESMKKMKKVQKS